MPAKAPRSLVPLVPLIAAAGLIAILSGALMAEPARSQVPQDGVDYGGFLKLGSEIEAYRDGRLISLVTFNAMKADPGTIIIDARSADAFQDGHINGAVNVPFSDFTREKLAEMIGSTDRRILIYCNNNFSDNVVPVMLKRAPLALNIPTFINLYGYGYTNIYELSGSHSITEPAVNWISTPVQEN